MRCVDGGGAVELRYGAHGNCFRQRQMWKWKKHRSWGERRKKKKTSSGFVWQNKTQFFCFNYFCSSFSLARFTPSPGNDLAVVVRCTHLALTLMAMAVATIVAAAVVATFIHHFDSHAVTQFFSSLLFTSAHLYQFRVFFLFSFVVFYVP